MVVLSLQGICKSYGANEVLKDVSFTINENEKVALVGINGAGKSTLFKIIAGELSPDEGRIIKSKGVEIGYLEQYTGLNANSSLWDEMLSVYSDLLEMEKEIREKEKLMSKEETLNNKKELNKIMECYSRLLEEFSSRGGYSIKSMVRGVLTGLGFSQEDYDKQVSLLSGGQKTRAALGKLLLKKPDILLLDEPTNYLDLDTLEWLEEYLKDYPGALLVISHDRYFLDSVTQRTLELENHKLKDYNGNYTFYVKQKKARRMIELKHYEEQQRQIKQMEEQIEQDKAWRRFSQANSRLKALEKIERMEKPSSEPARTYIKFNIKKSSGKEVLKVENLTKEYSGKKIFSDVSFEIRKNERVALIGPNGIGKSTLLKIVAGKTQPSGGNVKLGHNVITAYYYQELENLNQEKTLLDEIWDENPRMTQTEVRSLLGNFLFSGDDVFKTIGDLSGGEKSRVALLKLMLSKANFLLLDEPTNHLDMISKEVLEDALLEYPGTVLVVSHDRYFLKKIATRILELDENGLKSYLGGYDYYREKKAEIETKEKHLEKSENKREKRLKKQKALEVARKEREHRKRIEALEQQIIQTEERIQEFETLLCSKEIYTVEEKLKQINKEYQELKQKLEKLYKEWERAAG
ncbi:MAG: ATP-binding cassette, subfamily er 3 [Thermosediminibacterales bacterium]|nr:ATP-binding cassette, subfamily er 3 [Thermosediminibacterales bacterium]MDK2835668.1 ATP-binding cassette, subfamily er 3 [Thermosediminibacterales bacterium]